VPRVAITAVAFDMGGVLTEPPFAGLEAYAASLGLPTDALARYFRGDPRMDRLETGQITSREFFKYVCVDAEARHGVRIDIHALAAAAAQGEVLNPSMLAVVAAVRERCTTALLTNNVREAGWRATFPRHLFDVVVDSSEVGVRKPDRAIYETLVDRLGRPADEVAFVDDLDDNLPPAAELGMTVISFVGEARLRATLVDLGVLPVPVPVP
jgi:epoxide hydrolase-like predicted phosphatase